MVDGINWNPFTNQVLTPEQIKQLDKDGNGKVSYDELVDGLSWLSGGTDEDGVVDFSQFGDNLIDNVRKAGMGEDKNTINSKAELQTAMDTIADEFQEMYFKQNPGVDDSTRNMIKNLINDTKNDFIKNLTQNNPNGPWDLRLITDLFGNEMNQAIADKITESDEAKANVENLKKAGGTGNLESLLQLIQGKYGDEKNISNSEWKEIKDAAVQFLMGQLLSEDGVDEQTESFLNGLNKNYKSNSNYKTALDAINKIKSSSDPDEIQKQIEIATKALQNFLEVCGRDKTASAADSVQQSQAIEQANKDLAKPADAWLESRITASMTDEEKQLLKDFVNGVKDKFIENYYSTGKYKTISASEITAKFKTELDTQYISWQDAQKNLKNDSGSLTRAGVSKWDILVNAAKDAGSYITDDDKAKIINAASDLVLAQMINGMDDIPLLKALNPSYQKSSEFIELKGIVSQMKSCTDGTKLQELIKQAQTALQKLFDKYSGEQLVKAVDSLKPVEVSQTTHDNAIYNSEIYSDYTTGADRSTGWAKDKEGQKAKIEQMARDDMQKYATSLKAELKNQLGTAYDEAEIEKYLQSAMNDTISYFWTNNGFKYDSKNGGWLHMGHKRHKYTYDVSVLIDNFKIKFNAAAEAGAAQKQDSNAAPAYDKEDVLTDSGFLTEYGSGSVTKADDASDKNDQSKIINEARMKLSQLSTQLKANMIASGLKLDLAVIDKILNEATVETIKEYQFSNGVGFIGNYGVVGEYSYNTRTLFDNFFTKVDAKLEAAKKK